MCGLVGMVLTSTNGFFAPEQECFANLLHINQLRGQDSTGITAVYNDGEVEVMKNAVEASTMMIYTEYGSKEFKDIQKNLYMKGRAVLGHNRKATIGKVVTETAHPFVVDNKYFFMHNGTLRNHKKLCDGAGDVFEVDSEALANHLCPIADNIGELEKALSEVEGAYACQWVDQEKEILYLLRNKERPLWLAKTSVGHIWASEPSFIYASAQRNRIKIEDCKEVPEDTLLSMDLTKPTEFKGVALTVKKSYFPTTPITKGGVCVNKAAVKEGNLTNGKVSKSFFKRLQKKIIGQEINFWVDDFVERHYPDDNDEWLVWGTSLDTFDFPHRVQTVLKTLKSVVEHMFSSGALVKATITHLEFNPSSVEIIINVDKVVTVPRSCH